MINVNWINIIPGAVSSTKSISYWLKVYPQTKGNITRKPHKRYGGCVPVQIMTSYSHMMLWFTIIQHGSVVYSRDRYEIIGLRKSSHSIKQPCSSICLKKAFAIHQSCWNNAVPQLKKAENRIFQSAASIENLKPRPNFVCQPASLP